MAGLMQNVALGAVAGVAKGYGDGTSEKAVMEGKLRYEQMLTQARGDIQFRNRMAELAVSQDFTKTENQKTRDANIKMAGLKTDNRGLMTPQQAFTMAKTRNTEDVPDGTGMGTVKKVNWEGVKGSMARLGFGDYADALIGGESSGADPGQASGLPADVASERADAEASDKAGYFSTDSTDFAEDGGSREAYKTRRIQELMGGEQPQRRGLMPPVQEPGPHSQEVKAEAPPEGHPNARQATDGNWYVQTGTGKDGKPTYARVDPQAPTDRGGDVAPDQAAPDRKAERRQIEQTTIDQATAELDKLKAQQAEREQRRAEAAQKGRSVPQFDNQDKQLQSAIQKLEATIARAKGNLDLIG